MNKLSLKILIAVIISSMLFTACSKATKEASTSNEFNIVTSFYPMYIFTKNITKDIEGVKVVNMTEPQTGCLHDYELSPTDMKTLESADAFVINGAGMEAFMEKVVKQLPKVKVIEASQGIELLKNDSNEELNPHVWVGISDAIKEVENIAKGISAIDPQNAEKYNKNSEEYIKKLQDQKAKMHKELDGMKNKDIVTFHEAFPYFAKEFNLNIVDIIEREPGSEPSAGEIANTINIIKKSNVKALFAEPQYSPKAAETIAKETGAKVYTLDPLVSGAKDADPDAYIKTMELNLETLCEALK